MNSKTTVALMIVIIFLVFFFLSKNSTHNLNISNNDVSSHDNIAPKEIKNKSLKSIKTELEAINHKTINSKKASEQKAKKLTYLQAYRNKKFFSTCFWKLHDFQNNIDPLEKFRNYIIEKRHGTALGGGGLQEKYFMDHFNKCKEFLGDKENDIGEVSDYLDELFQSMKPISEEERDLSAYLELHIKRYKVVTRIYEEKEKENKSADVLLELNKSLEIVLFEIIDNLKTNSSPDVFLDNYFNFVEPIRSPFDTIPRLEDFILTNIQNDTNINDEYYLEILIELATPLFACSLGYPCDENSLLTYKYCVYQSNKNACGKTVEDFYLNDLISPNQQVDVNKVLDYFMTNYAQI